jgi:hypothetical protein
VLAIGNPQPGAAGRPVRRDASVFDVPAIGNPHSRIADLAKIMLHPADESTTFANLASQVGAVRSVGNA